MGVEQEIKDMGLLVRESDNPDREKIDFSIEDGNDNIAWVWGNGEVVCVDNKEYDLDYEVECDHAVIEYDDDETVGQCLVCGKYCDWHYESEWLDGGHDEDGNCIGQTIERRVPHEWHNGDGGIIKKYIEEKYIEEDY